MKEHLKLKSAVLILLIMIFSACDGGLEPPVIIEEEITYISGQIDYISGMESWPRADSVNAIRVVAFLDYPPQSIFEDLMAGKAFYTDTLKTYTLTDSFRIEFDTPPLTIKYLVVALQWGTNPLADWMAIGVYTLSGDPAKPTETELLTGTHAESADIKVDFNNLPPQPF